jgi:hypothetical protein
MKKTITIIAGLLSTALLNVGLYGAAERFDPVTLALDAQSSDATTDHGKVANQPCISCVGDES